ncbi:MAG: Hsp20/alpha crystallin family protein [Armatimonadetes bacterium]|nr:Hsp20/alpha crystallin family protein [Armatimonadota bacterium]
MEKMANITRWEPSGITSLREAMDRLFEDSFVWSSGLFPALRAEAPAVDMYQTDTEVVVKASLPGMKSEDVDITVTGDVITLKGEHREEQEVKEENYFRREMRSGSFTRTLPIPVPVNVDKAEAEFENGVLTVHLPKTEESKAKSVKVKSKK